MMLDKQDPRAQQLARDIAALIREYEAETENRVDALSIEKPAIGMYDVQVQIRMSARSLDTFTHSSRSSRRRLIGEEDEQTAESEGKK